MNTHERTCPSCGTTRGDTSTRFCRHCGAILPTARRGGLYAWFLPLPLLGLVSALVMALLSANPRLIAEKQPTPGATRGPSATVGTTLAPTATLPDTATPTTEPPTATPTHTATPTASPRPTDTSTPTRMPTATPPPFGYVSSQGDRLNVRAGPGVGYPTLAQAQDKSRAEILGRDATGDWFYIRTEAKDEGWVMAMYVLTNYAKTDILVIPTPPPPPTATPTPKPKGPNPQFRASQTAIKRGECVTLYWDVDGIKAVYLDDYPKAGHGSQSVCPTQAQTFTLTVVQSDGRRVDWPLTIAVSGETTVASFVIEHKGCIGHDSKLGVVKGQVFNRDGGIIVGAIVEILVEDQQGIVPLGRTNQDGWYEFNLSPNQRATFVRLEVNGQKVSFTPDRYTVKSKSGCYQRVNFRQQ